MELTVQNVYGLLLRSKLLSLDEARAMFARWNEEAKDGAGNLAKFAAWMVANKFLTEYQASLLARGHAEGFFLNDYKILDKLGKGRMAGVYKAQHRLGQVVAIKVLPPSKAREPNLLARFQREAKLAMRLRHPNIVRGFQMGLANGLNYLVMEHLDGETLEDVLEKRGKLSPAEGVRLIYQALQGLQHIHSQGLVHRDLKPSNLMLIPAATKESTLQSTLKILDIGLGRVLFDENMDERDPGLTGEGVLLGTPDYMAPEQARDPRTADIRADIYSLGCVLYHALGGQPPFPDTNIISQMIRHATEQPRSLRELNPAVPEGVEKIIGFLMAKDPAGRYPTPERAAQALETFLVAESAVLSSPDLDPNMRPYLTWLENEDRKASAPATIQATPAPPTAPIAPLAQIVPSPPSGKPPTSTIPAAGAVPPPVPVRSSKGTAERQAIRSDKEREALDRRKARKARRLPPPPGTSTNNAVPAAPVLIDVELVDAPPVAKKRRRALLTRRDLIAFGLGVGSTLLAIGIGYLFATLATSRRKKPAESPKEGE